MKKIILMAALLVGAMTQAQVIEVTGHEGEFITQDYVYTTNTLIGSQGADLPLHVKNLTDSDIYVKLKMDLVENGDNMDFGAGQGVQFCFGTLCYFEVESGDIVPSNIAMAKIVANGENPDGDHFLNNYEGDNTGLPVKYHMSFVQYNAENEPIGTLLEFTYVYDSTAGTTDFTSLQNIGINIQNTLVKNTLEVNANVAARLELFDVTGKKLSSFAIANGANAIDLSGLNAAVYIAKFTTEDNKASQIRIIKN